MAWFVPRIWRSAASECWCSRPPMHQAGSVQIANFIPAFSASVAHSVSHFSRKIAADLEPRGSRTRCRSGLLSTVWLKLDGEHMCFKRWHRERHGRRRCACLSRLFATHAPICRCTAAVLAQDDAAHRQHRLPDLLTFARMGLEHSLLGKRTCGNSCASRRSRPATSWMSTSTMRCSRQR